MIKRPMLAEKAEDISKLKYPLMASPKLDGIRCIIQDGQALSRNFKPIPNRYIQEHLKYLPEGFDGEILCPGRTFNEVQSDVMSEDGTPNFEYHVFDYVEKPFEHFDVDTKKVPFSTRYANAFKLVRTLNIPWLKIVEHRTIFNLEQLIEQEQVWVDEGFEGAMVRNVDGPYKEGRSTVREGYLLKIKRFADSEAEVIGFEELLHNDNEQEVNELGLSKRSTKKEGMKPAGMLGKFKVRDLTTGIEFDIGTGDGLTQALRKDIWDNREYYLGKTITYKYQPAGQKEKPRFPVWLKFRDIRDM